jgi:hypothetical protein
MKKSVWILTREINEYDQDGAYFETFWFEKPTLEQISQYVYSTSLESLSDKQILYVVHISKGGGRENAEDEWYNLTKEEEGVKKNEEL